MSDFLLTPAAPPSLLAPNATGLMRAIEQVAARRIEALSTEVDAVLDPQRCPARMLPWLAWSVSVDVWRSAWTDDTKRAVIAAALDVHRHKGTLASVRRALNALGAQVTLSEWWQSGAAPYTARARVLARDPHGAAQLSPELVADLTAAALASAPVRARLVFEFGVSFPTPITPTAALLRPEVQAQATSPSFTPGARFAPALTPIAAMLRPVSQAQVAGRIYRAPLIAGLRGLGAALTRPLMLAQAGASEAIARLFAPPPPRLDFSSPGNAALIGAVW